MRITKKLNGDESLKYIDDVLVPKLTPEGMEIIRNVDLYRNMDGWTITFVVRDKFERQEANLTNVVNVSL